MGSCWVTPVLPTTHVPTLRQRPPRSKWHAVAKLPPALATEKSEACEGEEENGEEGRERGKAAFGCTDVRLRKYSPDRSFELRHGHTR